MPNKLIGSANKNTCHRPIKHSCTPKSVKSQNVTRELVRPKKVINSKKISTCAYSSDAQTLSTGYLPRNAHTKVVPSKKTTKSDFCVTTEVMKEQFIDYCKKCGDTKESTVTSVSCLRKAACVKTAPSATEPSQTSIQSTKQSKIFLPSYGAKSSVQEYFLNENFLFTSDSVNDMENSLKKLALDTITEVPEMQTASRKTIQSSCEKSDLNVEELGFFNTDSMECIEEIKNFREKNFYECHSVTSRISQNSQNTVGHKCMYRFYLNDRLFPTPLTSDHDNTIRCVQCLLPFKFDAQKQTEDFINGTIQAKVNLNNNNEEDFQDMTLLLPVTEPLIIKERRKRTPKPVEDVVYFGIIKLSETGDSIFNRTSPSDSFALKYQKGYKKFKNNDVFEYRTVDNDDVVYE